MPNIPRPSAWNMGKYLPTEEDMKAASWCLNNGIKISPYPEAPGSWWIDIEINGKVNRSPYKYSKLNVWQTLHEFYRYYYNKYKK